jgi:hypothetical protein
VPPEVWTAFFAKPGCHRAALIQPSEQRRPDALATVLVLHIDHDLKHLALAHRGDAVARQNGRYRFILVVVQLYPVNLWKQRSLPQVVLHAPAGDKQSVLERQQCALTDAKEGVSGFHWWDDCLFHAVAGHALSPHAVDVQAVDCVEAGANTPRTREVH